MSLFPEIEKSPDGGAGKKKSVPTPRPSSPKAAPPETYQALARKYRPAAFDEVVGQDAVIATLKNAIAFNRLHHAYLFSGIRGVGKTTAARLFARALNCVEGPTTDPCGKCDPCREISSGQSLDVIELDAASNRGVDDVEPLREAARYAPARDRNKVFILDEAHMLSNAAFNSLLKILEEPPSRIVWILATTEYRKIPPTVVSRCQHFEFHRVSRPLVAGYLKKITGTEKVQVDPEGLGIIAATAGGSVRDAVSLLDQVISYAGASASAEDVRNAIGIIDRRLLLQFLKSLADRDAPGLLDQIASLAEGGIDFSQFATGLVTTIRDATVLRFSPGETRAVVATEAEAAELRGLAGAFNEDGLLRVFNAILDLPFALRAAPQPRFVLEAAALRLTRLVDLTPIEDLIREMQDGPGGGGARGSGSSAPRSATGSGAPPVPTAGGSGSFSSRLLDAPSRRPVSSPEDPSGPAGGGSPRLPGASPNGAESSAVGRAGPAGNFSTRLLGVSEGQPAPPPADPAGGTQPAAADPSQAPPPSARNRRERLIQEALSKPGVKKVIDTFNGQIVDIRELA
jgi:DNA polymerase-3 subunit gamma/tau